LKFGWVRKGLEGKGKSTVHDIDQTGSENIVEKYLKTKKGITDALQKRCFKHK